MKKSIIITGPQGSGKTTRMNDILSKHHTRFFKDEVVSYTQIRQVYSQALNAKTFCIIATQMDLKKIPRDISAQFEIINLK